MNDLPDVYLRAQTAMAELKAAIVQLLQLHPSLTNAEIGRSLGIYHGHVGHEGHIPRTLLALLQEEGIAEQDEDGRWIRVRYIESPQNPELAGTEDLCDEDELTEVVAPLLD